MMCMALLTLGAHLRIKLICFSERYCLENPLVTMNFKIMPNKIGMIEIQHLDFFFL